MRIRKKEAEQKGDQEKGQGQGKDLIGGAASRAHSKAAGNGKNPENQQACRGKVFFSPAADTVKKSIRGIEEISHRMSSRIS
jgi:hypothetical protein